MTFSFQKDRVTALSSEGSAMGYIVFPRIRAGLVNISEVTVLPAFRGQGVEDAMMEALLSHLEKQGLKAALTSPFAQQYLEDHPRWNQILPGAIHFTRY